MPISATTRHIIRMKKGIAVQTSALLTPPFASAFMSIMPPDSCTVSEAGVGVTIGLTSSPSVIFVLTADHHAVARFKTAGDLGQLRSLQPDLDIANVDAIVCCQAT